MRKIIDPISEFIELRKKVPGRRKSDILKAIQKKREGKAKQKKFGDVELL